MQTGNIELQALGTLKDGGVTPSVGTSGQILSSTITSTKWIDAPTGGTTYVGAESFKFATTTGVASVGNVFWASRIFIENSTVVNRIACYAISGGTGNVRMGIYDDAGTTRIAQASNKTSIVAGLNEFTLVSDVTLSSGTFYYILLQSNANTPNPSYYVYTGYIGNLPVVRARVDQNNVTDPSSGMATSITANPDARALWVSLYRV